MIMFLKKGYRDTFFVILLLQSYLTFLNLKRGITFENKGIQYRIKYCSAQKRYASTPMFFPDG